MEGREACVIELHCILYEWSRARIFVDISVLCEDNLHANTTPIHECHHIILVRGQGLCILVYQARPSLTLFWRVRDGLA